MKVKYFMKKKELKERILELRECFQEQISEIDINKSSFELDYLHTIEEYLMYLEETLEKYLNTNIRK